MSNPYQNPGGLGGRFSMMPPVLKSLIIINVIVHAVNALIFSMLTLNGIPIIDYIHHYLALSPVGENFGVWQLLTYQFLHGDIWHLFFNMLALWMFGSEIEQMWGSRKFLIFYLLCGIGAGLFQMYISPLFGPVGYTIGASGAVYGVLLAFALTFPRRPIFMFPIFIPIPAIIYVGIFILISIFMGVGGSGGVAHFAHLGGAATGYLLFKFGDKLGIFNFVNKIFPSKKSRYDSFDSYYNRGNEEPRVYKTDWYQENRTPNYSYKSESKSENLNVEGEEVTRAKIDEILDKISASGYEKLTDREKKILFELSKKL